MTSITLRQYCVKIVLALAGLFVAFLLFEVCIRLFDAFVKVEASAGDRPKYYYKSGNTKSFQNHNFENEKPADVFRVVVLGDSFTSPHALQFDDTFSLRLERMLNVGHPASAALHAEVINFGKAGMGTAQEAVFMKSALNIKPDMVLLEITLNDPAADAIKDLRSMERKYKGKYTFGSLEISRKKTPLLYYSKALRFIAARLHNRRTRTSYTRYHKDLFFENKTWQSFAHSIRVMHNAAKRAGVYFGVVIFPLFDYPLDSKYPFHDVHQKIRDYMKERSIPCLDLFSAYSGMRSYRLVVAEGKDSHPNEIAHRIAAEEIYLWLERQNILPKELLMEEKYAQRPPRIVRYQPPAETGGN